MARLMNVLQALDNLREEIVKGLESELQNDAPAAAITMHQKWRLCEIGLEDYSSLLLSRFLVSLEAVGGATWLAKHVEKKNVESWNGPLGALIKSIHQLGLSGWKAEECRAIGNELIAWQETSLLEIKGDEDGTRIWGLRLKATLERAERLTKEYSEALFNIFPEEKVQILGEAFKILKNNVKTYAEAEIRADVIIQVSYLCTLLLKAVREVVNARGWDILVPGNAFGKLIEVENIESIPSSETETEPHIVVVKKSEGDKEVKAAGVGGVILLQGLPHLSHLVLRARKEKIVVTTCEDDEEVLKIRSLSEEDVMLVASSDGVSLTPVSFPTVYSIESEPPVKPFEIYKGLLNSIGGAMRVEDIEALARCVRVKAENICGTKAAAFCRLASLAAESIQVINDVGVPTPFKVPKGAVIPFCSIQRALNIDKAKSSSYLSLVESIEKAEPPDDTAALHDKLRELISSLSSSEEAIIELSNIFPDSAQLILLPSASVEDLREIRVSGKGEPILTSSLFNRDRLKGAISSVWASLYSPEAFLSRKVAHVGVRDADMAVLVQEMLSPELSFVLHIVSPIDDDKVLIELEEDGNRVEIDIENEDVNEVKTEDENKDVIEVEIVPGLGVALASGTGATPWRLSYDKTNDTVETLAFANFSEESVMWSGGTADGEVVKLIVDYSKKPLTMDRHFRQQLGRRLGAVGRFLAKKLRGRHDVEGCLVGEDIYIMQTRMIEQNKSGNLGVKMGL